MKHKTCTVDGCGKKHRAGGLCSTHYNQQRYTASERHPVVTVACGWCGRDCVKGETVKFAERFCSLRCRDGWRAWRAGQAETLLPLDRRSCPVPEDHPARWKPVTYRVFYRNCVVCDLLFATPYTRLTCSVGCQRSRDLDDRREAKHRRRARQRGAFVARVYRRRIYERDGYTCQLCGQPIDPDVQVPHLLAGTLDHVVPLSRGGTHEPSNCRTAHYICNVRRGAGDRDDAESPTVAKLLV